MDNEHKAWQGEERRSLSSLEKKIDDISDCVVAIKKAFPNGDIDGHRRYHDARIKAAVAEEAFWKDLKLDVAKKGAWGLITIIVGLIILGISTKLGAVVKIG